MFHFPFIRDQIFVCVLIIGIGSVLKFSKISQTILVCVSGPIMAEVTKMGPLPVIIQTV